MKEDTTPNLEHPQLREPCFWERPDLVPVFCCIIAICGGLANLACFYDLPEYCSEYQFNYESLDNVKTTKTTTTSSEVLGLNVIFLIDAALLLYFADTYREEEESDCPEPRECFNVVTMMVCGVYFLCASITKFILIIIVGISCNHAFWFPMTAASVNIALLSILGWFALCIVFIVCLVVFSPVYLICDMIYTTCVSSSYSTPQVIN